MYLDAPLKRVPGLGMPVIDERTPEGQRAIWRALANIKGIPPMAGGAEIFPDEGLDHILNKVPRATTAIQTTYHLGLFTTATSSTTPARTETLASAGVGEPTTGAYARVSTANTDWGAIATSGSGRRTTSAQKSFPENTASWGNINGFLLANQAAAGAGSIAIFYANFDDGQAVPATVAGYTIRVTPYFHIDG